MARVKLDFRGLLKAFLASDVIENPVEDIIKNSNEITEQEKKELLKTLADNEKIAEKSTGIPKVRTSRLKVDSKEAINKTLKENPIKVDSKTGKVLDKNDDSREL
jgi:uncharacterized membrane protein YkoI